MSRIGIDTISAVSQQREEGAIAMGRGARSILLMVGLLTLLTGLLLFLAPGAAGVGSSPPSQPPAGDQLWPWPLRTPLNARFFGAFFLSVGIGALLALRERRWERIRILFPPGIIFTTLGLIAAALSFASFRPERIATWLFFGLYAFVLLGELGIFIAYERRSKSAARV